MTQEEPEGAQLVELLDQARGKQRRTDSVQLQPSRIENGAMVVRSGRQVTLDGTHDSLQNRLDRGVGVVQCPGGECQLARLGRGAGFEGPELLDPVGDRFSITPDLGP